MADFQGGQKLESPCYENTLKLALLKKDNKGKMKSAIHINQHVIRKNNKTGERNPVITCKSGKSNEYGHEAIIFDLLGNEVARVVYRPDKPLSCGAKVWVEVKSENGSVQLI